MKKSLLLITLIVLTALTAQARNIWNGSEAIDWNKGKGVQIASDKFADVREGDQLVFGIVFTGNTDWPQLAPTKGDWSGNLTGTGNTALAAGMTEVKYVLLKGMVTDLKATGLVVGGVGFTLISVDIVEGDGGDYSHAVWIGECKIGNWTGYQHVGKSAFNNAVVGQKLRVKFKDLGAGAYLSLRNPVDGWPDLSGAGGVYISGSYHQFDITAAMLSELQANGMVISGVNFTATAVELWNADEIKPLKLQVPVSYNWVFEGDAVPTFYVGITNPYSTAVEARIVMEVATDKMAFVTSSSKTAYNDVKAASWNVEDEKKAMQDRLTYYGAGERPDMVLAAADNASQGAIAALEEAGITNMPVITGQDNSVKSQEYIKNGKQTMTIDKNLKEMAYNTAMIINSLVNNSPIRTSQSISGIPVFYSKITVMTQDSY